ncbi:MAG: carboxypeptidase regulatory-like domain-containing protein [Myxococcales bacterium]|nr:carboxypeptidase regulatory-like domain-containing protein [Myxococcales bacterium]
MKVIVVALIGGGALWWLLAGNADEPANSPEQGARAGTAEGDGSGPSGADGLRPRALLSSATALLGAPRASIRGTIRDHVGRAIPGAQVCAVARSPILPSEVRKAARCVTSEGDGAYRIDELLGVNQWVTASAPTFIPAAYTRGEGARRRDEVVLRPGMEAQGIDITLRGGGVEITGVIKDLSGGAIEGAQLTVDEAIGFSGDEGRFSLWVAPGDRWLSAWADGYARGSDGGVAPGHEFEVFLTPEAVLIGKVVRASDGAPVEGATVSPIGGQWGWSDASAITDAAGKFRIVGLEPGAYKPSVVGDDVYGKANEQVILGLGETSAPITVSVHPAFMAVGEVAIVGGGACDKGWVELNDRASARRVHADLEGGEARLRGLFPGEYQVRVHCSGYVAEERYEPLTIADSSVEGLRWEVKPGQAIRGQVVDGRGEPAAGVSVSARPKIDAAQARAQATSAWSGETDEAGRFELAGLLPGDYELGVSAWRPPRATPKEPLPVTLRDGHDVDDLTITLPASGELRGRVIDSEGEGVGGATISLEQGPSWRRCTADDEGAFACPELLPGSYRAVPSLGFLDNMRAPGSGDDDLQGERVEIVEGEVREVELVVETATGVIHGVVRDEEGGPVADAFIESTRESEQSGSSSAQNVRMSRWGSFAGGHDPVLSDADGRFTLTRLAPGKHTILAHRKGGGEAILEHAALDEDVVLTIASTGRLAGSVSLAGGGAPEEFTVSIRDEATGFHRSDAFFRTDGAFSLPEVPAGSYKVNVSAGAGTAEAEATLAAGEEREDLRIELAPKVTARGRIVDEEGSPVAGIVVQINGRGGGMVFGGPTDDKLRNVSDEDGRFEVERAPTGAVRIMTSPRSGDEFGWTSIPAFIEPASSVVELPPIEVHRLRVKRGEVVGDLGLTLQQSEPGADPLEHRLIVAFARPGGGGGGGRPQGGRRDRQRRR